MSNRFLVSVLVLVMALMSYTDTVQAQCSSSRSGIFAGRSGGGILSRIRARRQERVANRRDRRSGRLSSRSGKLSNGSTRSASSCSGCSACASQGMQGQQYMPTASAGCSSCASVSTYQNAEYVSSSGACVCGPGDCAAGKCAENGCKAGCNTYTGVTAKAPIPIPIEVVEVMPDMTDTESTGELLAMANTMPDLS